MPENILDAGDYCVWCQKDTSFGSGRFVNRIPVSADIEGTPWDDSLESNHTYTGIVGYGCDSCYEGESN